MNALQLTVFTQKTLQQTFSSEVRFYTEIGRFALLSPDDHLRLILKRVVYFLLVLIELFPLDVMAVELWANIG